MLKTASRPTGLRVKTLISGWTLAGLILVLLPGSGRAATVSTAAPGMVALSDAAMAETVARGAPPSGSGIASTQPSVTLWDEIKPPPRPTPPSAGVTVTLNGLPSR
jgi:hypothetical protein